MRSLGQDLRYSARQLLTAPGVSFVAVLLLALGIGANTAIFSLLDQMLIRPLPVARPAELVHLQPTGPSFGRVEGPAVFSHPMFRDFQRGAPGFAGVLATYEFPASLGVRSGTERGRGELVSGNYFQVLGVPAALGRTLSPEDDRTTGGHPVAVLSHEAWVRRFGADPEVLGQKIRVNGSPLEVVGVAARGFRGIILGRPPDVFVPLAMKGQMTPTFNGIDDRRYLWLSVFARLQPGISAKQAQAMVNSFWKPLLEAEAQSFPARMSQAFVKRFTAKNLVLAPGQQGRVDARGGVTAPLLVLGCMAGLVLLIACGNVASLLIAKAAARQKEVAIRLSLGAGRWRLVRQLVVESTLLSLAGGALGLLVALWTGSLLIGFLPFEDAGRVISAEPDARVLLFALALSLGTGIVFGLIPALQATRTNLVTALKDQASNVSPGGAQARLRKVLVTAQVALSLVLLTGAGLFARSLYNLRALDTGMRTENLVQFSVDPSLSGYDTPRTRRLLASLQAQLASLPGVEGATISENTAFTDSEWSVTVAVEGYQAKDGEDMNPVVNRVGPGYFKTLGIPLLLGREINERDTAEGSRKVCVINETMARYYFGNSNPLGRRIGLARDKPDIEIVGVVKESKYLSLRQQPRRMAYFPYTQVFDEFGAATLYVRTPLEPQAMAALLRRQVRQIDAGLPIYALKTVELQVAESISLDRAVAALSALFGGLATLLAAVGLYGVMAYTVARRTREFGVRVALGADSGRLLWMVLREAAWMTGLGIAIALPVAWGLGRLAESQLFGVKGNDPFSLVAATVVLALTAAAASGIPAWRATRTDPMTALRYE